MYSISFSRTSNIFRDFSARKCKEYIFESTIGKESLHEANNDNGAVAVNFATLKSIEKRTTFPYNKTHKYTWASYGKTHNEIVLIDIINA